ncbi:MAG: hypothetical protein HOB82_06340 [Alphaproteobacteria bacterium]|jgi:hypothetical protein|nr:hypothetical protein [Alphaproteobacteria bacterium]MBT5859624.1 hypothetical protein [Alphaproteobacteria bacterium]
MVYASWLKSALASTAVAGLLWAAPGAVAQDFKIPSVEQLAQMSAADKGELERQLTAEAVGWPKVSLNETLVSPDPMEVPHSVRGGTLVGADALHPASGDATVFDLGGENFALRIADGDIAIGPGLHVYLVNARAPESADHIISVGFLDLGPLKAHLGSHNYPLPGGVGAYRSVVIYSQPFDVIFAVASIQ